MAANDNIFIADELMKLKQLQNDGIITEEEFNTQKERLLGTTANEKAEEKSALEKWREEQVISTWRCPVCGAPNNSSKCAVCHYDPSKDYTKRNEDFVLSCPRCGSTSVATGQRGWKITTGFWGSSRTVNRCGACGYTWKP